MDEDVYAENAEWYAALMAGWGDAASVAVRELLGPLADGDVVDIAAGVGTGLSLLRDLGAGRIFAVEPSRAMRAGLMTTIAADADLMDRTTVIPAGAPEALEHVPAQWSGGTMLNAIGHLDDADRHQLWAALHARLAPGATFVISLQPPHRVEEIPWTEFGDIRVGERVLHTRGRADPRGSDHVTWTMEWTVAGREGGVLETRTARHDWRVLDVDQLRDELDGHGIEIRTADAEANVLGLRRSDRAGTPRRDQPASTRPVSCAHIAASTRLRTPSSVSTPPM